MEVWAINDDLLGLGVILDICNADVSVDVEEYDERIVVHAKNHDSYLLDAGSDDCQNVVRVDLDKPLSGCRVTISSPCNPEIRRRRSSRCESGASEARAAAVAWS
jgi:hypothetical protein